MLALVAARILEPESKLATTRSWHVTSLPTTLGVADADADELYAAMDWLLQRQDRIEQKLAARHLHNDGLALYDPELQLFRGPPLSPGFTGPQSRRQERQAAGQLRPFDQRTGPARFGVGLQRQHGRSDDLAPRGREDAKRLWHATHRFGRRSITQKQVDALREIDGIDWIAALRPEAIKKLIPAGQVQMRLFDERNLFELTHADFPGERLVACRNPELARRRAEKRQSLLEATGGELGRVRGMVERGRLRGQEQIGKAVQRVLNQYKIGKCYRVEIRDDGFDVQVDPDQLTAEQARDARVPPKLAQARQQRRQRHRRAIDEQLGKIRQRIGRGQLHGKDEIGVRVGKVVNKYKVGKHFKLDIQDDGFDFELDPGKVAAEAALDGIYVVRTSLAKQVMSAADAVRSYKLLSQVERAFRSFKTLDLEVRPIYHHLERRVRAHIFLCLLAYYVQWHMLEAWRPLLFSDEDLEAKTTRDPVAPASRSEAAQHKALSRTLEDGSQVHSFCTLLKLLSGIVKNICRIPAAGPDAPTFEVLTTPNPKQQSALDLLKTIQL